MNVQASGRKNIVSAGSSSTNRGGVHVSGAGVPKPKCPSSMSSILVSVELPTDPALAQNFDRCLEPESQRIVTILCPGPIVNADCTAATPIQPGD